MSHHEARLTAELNDLETRYCQLVKAPPPISINATRDLFAQLDLIVFRMATIRATIKSSCADGGHSKHENNQSPCQRILIFVRTLFDFAFFDLGQS
jgi:hypothetical protein